MDQEVIDAKKQAAIEAALTNNWTAAVHLNKEILTAFPDDIETLNRLGRAFMEGGFIGKAKSTYRTVLALDPYNTIAAKNVEKLASLSKQDLEKMSQDIPALISADLFLEELGKTRVIELEDLAMDKVLATLHTGDPVNFEPHGDQVTITQNKRRLGKLGGEYGQKIAKALRGGSKFSAVVKATAFKKSKKSAFTIFVREIYHSPKIESGPFFPPTNNNHQTSYVREDALGIMDHSNDLMIENDEETGESTPVNPSLHEEETEEIHRESVDDEENYNIT